LDRDWIGLKFVFAKIEEGPEHRSEIAANEWNSFERAKEFVATNRQQQTTSRDAGLEGLAMDGLF